MSLEGVNWWDKAINWAWTLVVAVGIAALDLIRRVYKHEERITALEVAANARTLAIDKLSAKLDTQNAKMDGQTAVLMERMDTTSNELRADLRLITSKLLDRLP